MNLNHFSWFLKKTLKYYTIFKPKNLTELKKETLYYNKPNKLPKKCMCYNKNNCGHINNNCGHINTWDVSNINYMGFLFDSKTYFNQLINNWNVSNIVDTSEAGTL